MRVDAAGKVTFAGNNLVLNSATLATQSVTVQSGLNYIVAFAGTGSVVLSGAAVATILGTGVNNQVFLKITAATSSLTLTVAGSVTSARVSAVTYETAPRAADDVDTGGSAFYGQRFDYGSAGLLGLLAETAATNAVVQSAFAASWTASRVTLTPAFAAGPDGQTSAARILSDATASNTHFVQQGGSYTSGLTYTLSAIFHQSGPFNWCRLAYPSSAFGTAYVGYFDVLNGVVGVVTSGASAKITALPGGFFLCELTATATTTTTGNYIVSIIQTNNVASFNGDSATAVLAWGAQIEARSWASSRIITGTAGVTRAGDTLSAALYSSNPAIIQYRAAATRTRARKKLATWSTVSAETDKWLEAIRIYPVGTSNQYLDAHLAVDGAW